MADNKDEEIRVGVFVCHCGSNIGGLVNCKKLAEESKQLPNVAYSEDNIYTCSENGLNSIKKAIQEHNLNRIVVCSCTPRTHETLFRETVQEAGLNKYLFNFVNIRDQCTWVHMKNPKEAYEKIKDLIRMGVAKSSNLQQLEDIKVSINPGALVIGGGIAGMAAALSLSSQGFKTHLIEKQEELGGLIKGLFKLYPGNIDAKDFLNSFTNKLKSSKNLEIHTSTMVKEVNGFVGNYNVLLQQKEKKIRLDVGAIIVAVGASNFTPKNLFAYDGKIRITQYELERKLRNKEKINQNIVMIQCAGSRIEERTYCSGVCCTTAIKNALIIKESNPEACITILFRDLYTPGVEAEGFYKKAREKGIIFIRYNVDKPPIVEEKKVIVFNDYINQNVVILYDHLVLSTPLIAQDDNKELAQLLKVPLEQNGFFLEAHVKLRPIDFATDGVFLSGAAKWPVDISEAIAQGYGAASRSSTILSHDTLEVEGATANFPIWNKDLCKGCEICIKVCPYKAIKKNEMDEIEIIRAVCKGCGVCGATCTKKAIIINHFTNDQILSEIYALGGKSA